MNAFLELNGNDLWHIAGWTMLHFLWIGALVGVVAAICRMMLRRASPQVRYAVALVSLALLAVLPVAIFGWLAAKPQASGIPREYDNAMPEAAAVADHFPELPVGDEATRSSAVDYSVTTPGVTADPTPAVFASDAWVAYLPWLWIVGTPLTFTLLATGVVGAERLRRTSRLIDEGPIAEASARLAKAMQIGRRVVVATCERIAAPVLVGIVRPVILLPPAALTGWSPDEIEMVLLHELAHVRRWDNLVNLLQRIVESLLFFHPVVWWMSGLVRREREACCDAVVVGRTNRPHAYAEMLLEFAARLSEPGRPRPRFASATTSAIAAGSLRARIRRILQLEDDPMLVSSKSFVLVVGGLLIAATSVVLYLPSRGNAEESATEATESTEADGSNTTSAEQRARSGTIDLREVQIPSGKRLAVVLPRPISPDAVSAAVKKLNEEGHNVHVQATKDATLLFVYGAERSERFPSLEDQKLADLAYRMLHLELEPIGEDDLRRVRALGYDGGVRVMGGRSVNDGVVRLDDILVGLHVWPTTSLQDVAAVLERDDLAELSPLKFYVVRPITMQVDADKWGPDAEDMPVTGRIVVSSGAFGGMRTSPRTSRTNDSGDELFQMAGRRATAQPQSAAAAPADESRYSAPATAGPSAPPQLPAGGRADEKSALRYEGRTFGEWRQDWLNQGSLSVGALQALEAFAAAGRGQEVNEVILVGAYSSATANARETRKYLSTLPAPEAAAIVARLLETLDTELSANRRIKAIRAIAAMGPNSEIALEKLKERLATDNQQERIAAAAAIKMIVGKDQYQKPVADVLGEELGITVVKTDSGAWGALPREDAKDDGKAFGEFNDAVDKEQERLFPDSKF